MTLLENFAQLAALQSTNYEERLALHIKLLEAHTFGLLACQWIYWLAISSIHFWLK